MNRTHAVLLAVAVTSGFTIVATAGAPVGPLATDGIDVVPGDDENDAIGHLELEPHPGPNGKYAFVNEETGELEVAVGPSNPKLEGERGVSVEAGTTIDDVFLVRYNASRIDREEPVRIWIEREDDEDVSLTFVSDGQPIEGESANLALEPGETAAVGLHVDSAGAEPGTVRSNFTIRAEFPEESESEESGSGDAGTTGGGYDGTNFVVTADSDGVCEATVYRARGGEPTTLDACDVEISDGVVLDGVTFTTAIDDDVDVRLEGNASPFAGGGTLDPAETGAAPLGYFTAEIDPTAADVTRTGYEITVSNDRLAAPGLETPGNVSAAERLGEIDPAAVRLYGYDPESGTWTPLETTVEPTDEGVRLRGESTEFPMYAVGVDVPAVGISDAGVEPTTVEVGENATVTATVGNDGRADGEARVVLRANGDVITTETVAVPAGGESVVTFEPSFEAPGTYEIDVNGEPAGELAVEAPATDDGEESTEDAESTGDGGSTDGEESDDETTQSGETDDVDGTDGTESGTDTGPSTDAGTRAGTDDTPTETDDAPTGTDGSAGLLEEPAGIDLERTVGLVSFLAITLSTAYLVRRMPR
ncbi:MAG: DUF1102 domain-containing protein [Haloferacaceae archaeon]